MWVNRFSVEVYVFIFCIGGVFYTDQKVTAIIGKRFAEGYCKFTTTIYTNDVECALVYNVIFIFCFE